MQGGHQVEGEILTLVDFDLLSTPINDPVFQDTAA
jgi:hypothetical protein